jgi:hypothetical protein
MKLVKESLDEYGNHWVRKDKDREKVLDFDQEVLNNLLQWMDEDEAFAAMETSMAQDMLAQAATRRKNPVAFARRLMKSAQQDWETNADDAIKAEAKSRAALEARGWIITDGGLDDNS